MSANEAEENIISKFKGTSATSLALNAKLAPKGQAGKSWVMMLVIAANVGPSKKMGDRTRQRKKSLTSVGIEPTTSGLDRPLLYRISYETRREEVLGDNSGNLLSLMTS